MDGTKFYILVAIVIFLIILYYIYCEITKNKQLILPIYQKTSSLESKLNELDKRISLILPTDVKKSAKNNSSIMSISYSSAMAKNDIHSPRIKYSELADSELKKIGKLVFSPESRKPVFSHNTPVSRKPVLSHNNKDLFFDENGNTSHKKSDDDSDIFTINITGLINQTKSDGNQFQKGNGSHGNGSQKDNELTPIEVNTKTVKNISKMANSEGKVHHKS